MIILIYFLNQMYLQCICTQTTQNLYILHAYKQLKFSFTFNKTHLQYTCALPSHKPKHLNTKNGFVTRRIYKFCFYPEYKILVKDMSLYVSHV